MTAASISKEERLAIRIAPEVKDVLRRAAEKEHASLSYFIVRAALDRAETLLAEETRFVVSQEAMDAFCAALDAPARDIPELRKLLSEPGVFER
ncbi:MAG: DUF1778 domain-containing protein [Sulfurisoma sp.]|nr:DUF1778 domain-containing protein [Sulfurisoma sp.]